jgi:hypothetical protein
VNRMLDLHSTKLLVPTVLLACLIGAAPLAAQVARPGPTEKFAKGRAFSGRVVDGLGRPVPGVKVTVRPFRIGNEKAPGTVIHTGNDGRYAGKLATDDAELDFEFEKEGYSYSSTITDKSDLEITLTRKVDWDEASSLPYCRGDELERGLRELLASEEWEVDEDGELLGFLFKNQDHFRPALRRIVSDSHVGVRARDWLELLGDAADRDLFPEGRKYTPKKEVKETDLIEDLKAVARQRDSFSSKPEPLIDLDFIAFTKDLDRVLIQCGINRAAMTGITWQFVFRKVGKQWELHSAKEVGRS